MQDCSGGRKTKKKRETGTKRKKERGQRNEATYVGKIGANERGKGRDTKEGRKRVKKHETA